MPKRPIRKRPPTSTPERPRAGAAKKRAPTRAKRRDDSNISSVALRRTDAAPERRTVSERGAGPYGEVGSGWRPATFDARDLRFTDAAVSGTRQVLPPSRSLPNPFPVVDQGDVPCCVSIAVATCMEAIDAQNGPSVRLSPLFNYFVARPNPERLPTLELRDALNAAVRTGICDLALHDVPYTPTGALRRPSDAAFQNAQEQRIAGPSTPLRPPRFRSLPTDATEWRRALAMGMPVAIGFWVTNSYRSLTASNPVHGTPTGRTSEGHAVTILGYDDQKRLFTVKDSRGRGFGSQGLWFLPYGLLPDGLVHEAWAVEKLIHD